MDNNETTIKKSNVLDNKTFMVLREIKTDCLDGTTLFVPDWFGKIYGEAAEGWFYICTLSFPELQIMDYRVIRIEELKDARFYYLDDHLKRDYGKIVKDNRESGLMPKTEF